MFHSKNTLDDPRVVAVDHAIKNGDYTAITIMELPGPIRKFFRRIGIDRSKWQYKIVSIGYVKNKQ